MQRILTNSGPGRRCGMDALWHTTESSDQFSRFCSTLSLLSSEGLSHEIGREAPDSDRAGGKRSASFRRLSRSFRWGPRFCDTELHFYLDLREPQLQIGRAHV